MCQIIYKVGFWIRYFWITPTFQAAENWSKETWNLLCIFKFITSISMSSYVCQNYFWQQLWAEECFESSSFNQTVEFKSSELGNILINAKRWILKASFCTCSWTRFCESSVYNMSLASLAGIMAKSSTCFCSRWRFLRSRRKMRADRDPNLMKKNAWWVADWTTTCIHTHLNMTCTHLSCTTDSSVARARLARALCRSMRWVKKSIHALFHELKS